MLIADWLVQHAYHDGDKLLHNSELLLEHKQGHVHVDVHVHVHALEIS